MILTNDIKSFESVDEKIQKVNLNWGRNDRPFWKTIEKMQPNAQIKWCDRISAYEAVACEWALAMCYEKALNIKVSVRSNHIRALLAELQRLLWGFNYLKQIFTATDDTIRVEQALRIREYLFQGQEIFTGSRVLPQALCIGGVERDFSVGDIRKFKEILKNVEFEIRTFFKDLTTETLFSERLSGVLICPRSVLEEIHWLGPIGQASGIHKDLRNTDHYGTYSDLSIKYFIAGQEGNSINDGLARVQSVLFQIRQSINICYHLLVSMPDGDVRSDYNPKENLPSQVIMSQVEGATGPVVATLERNRIQISTVSMRVKSELEKIILGMETDDLMLGLATLGFCFEEADLV